MIPVESTSTRATWICHIGTNFSHLLTGFSCLIIVTFVLPSGTFLKKIRCLSIGRFCWSSDGALSHSSACSSGSRLGIDYAPLVSSQTRFDAYHENTILCQLLRCLCPFTQSFTFLPALPDVTDLTRSLPCPPYPPEDAQSCCHLTSCIVSLSGFSYSMSFVFPH